MLRAIILIALVGHAAAKMKCALTSDAYGAAAGDCDDISGVPVSECYTLVPTDANAATQRGCGGAAQCAIANVGANEGACTKCTGDACNAKILKCWVGTVTDGVLDGATKACAPADANCYSRSLDATPTTMDKGCGVCDTAKAGTDGYTCATDTDCGTAADECNIPRISCFTSDSDLTTGTSTTACNAGILTCFTRTKTDDKSVDYGCGECKAEGTDYTCGAEANCGTITAKGCNEPPVFECLISQDWKEGDGTVATTCGNTGADMYTLKGSCTKTHKADDKIEKGCGKCPAKAVKGETCYQCDETGCNSASGLFSVLALSMAVIYQLA